MEDVECTYARARFLPITSGSGSATNTFQN
jgi:hypothetical protein